LAPPAARADHQLSPSPPSPVVPSFFLSFRSWRLPISRGRRAADAVATAAPRPGSDPGWCEAGFFFSTYLFIIYFFSHPETFYASSPVFTRFRDAGGRSGYGGAGWIGCRTFFTGRPRASGSSSRRAWSLPRYYTGGLWFILFFFLFFLLFVMAAAGGLM